MSYRKYMSRISNRGTGLIRRMGRKVPDRIRPIPIIEPIYYKIVEVNEDIVPEERVEVDLGEFSMIVDPSASSLGREIYEYGTRKNESGFEKVLDRLSFDGMTYFDVGANWGYYVLSVGARNEGCDLVAFEPHPTNADILEENLEINNIEATVVRKAVSDMTNDDVPWDENEDLESGSISTHGGESESSTSVETVRFEDYLGKSDFSSVDLVKIDVEGAENLVLRGFGDAWKNVDGLVIELHTPSIPEFGGSVKEIIDKLNRQSYDIYHIDNNGKGDALTEKKLQGRDLEDLFSMTPSTVHHLVALAPGSKIHGMFPGDVEQVIG